MITVEDILQRSIKEMGGDGLCNPDHECVVAKLNKKDGLYYPLELGKMRSFEKPCFYEDKTN